MARIPSTRLAIVITEQAYARAVLAAIEEGISLAEYTEAALAEAVKRTTKQSREAEYQRACQEARTGRGIAPTRWEYFGDRSEAYNPSFVRRPAGVGDNQAGRPSSRRDQKAMGAQPGSKARSGTGATRSFSSSKSEHGEDQPFDPGEHHGTTNAGPRPKPSVGL